MKKIIMICLAIVSCLSLYACANTASKKGDHIIKIAADAKTTEYIKNYDTKFRDDTWDDVEKSREYIENYRGKDLNQSYEVPKLVNTLKKTKMANMDVVTLEGDKDADRILLYLHGGGFTYSLDPTHLTYVDQLVSSCNMKAYIPLYKLIPDYTCDDTYPSLIELYKELLKEGKKIVLSGDSAGGNMSMVLSQKLNELGIEQPSLMILHSPATDFVLDKPQYDKKKETEVNVGKAWAIEIAKYWGNGRELTDPVVSPYYGSMEGMPKTMLFASTNELLYDVIYNTYRKMREAGVDATFVETEGGMHVLSESDNFKEGQECIQLAIDYINGN